MKKVLIIEDEEILRNLLRKKLSAKGYETKTAVDGKEGFEKVKKENPDIILLDLIMPKMNGFDVLEKLEKDEKLSNIPVIIVSNSGQPVEIDKAKKFGVKDWIVKTNFDLDEVIKKVVSQIGNP